MSTELMIFFGVLFAALNVIDKNRSKDWNIRDEKPVLRDDVRGMNQKKGKV
jgi:hypothetical protein